MKAAEQIIKTSPKDERFLLQEPLENSYSIVEPHKMNLFPYAFLGILRSKFQLGNKTVVTEGVGIIIGDDIVLTSADNLYYNTNMGKFLYPSTIEFIPGINGNIQIFKAISCRHFIFNEKFREMKKLECIGRSSGKHIHIHSSDIALYDYAIVFLPGNIGGEIISLFGMENDQRFGYSDQTLKIYNFFEEYVNLMDKLECIHKKGFSDCEISMVSFTRYSSVAFNDKNYRYKSSFANVNRYFSMSNQRAFIQANKTSISTEEKKLNDTYISTRRSTENSFLTCESPAIDVLLRKNSFFISNDQYSGHCGENFNMGNYFLFHKKDAGKTALPFSESYLVGDVNFYSEDQSVLCEVKGRVLKLNDESKGKELLTYLITTYMGQSGSPIFLRIKNKYLSNRSTNANEDLHELVLLGIHAAPKIQKVPPKKKIRDYNMGPLLTSTLVENLKKMILHKKSDIGYILTPQITPEYNDDYNVVQIFAYNEFILQGLFHKMSVAGNLFIIAEKIFNIPEILLLFRVGEQTLKREDEDSRWKTIRELSADMRQNDENNRSITLKIYFEIDITSYGAIFGKRVMEKVKETEPKIEEELLKKDAVAINKVVQMILREIQSIYSKSMFLYGLLFKAIKDSVFQDVL